MELIDVAKQDCQKYDLELLQVNLASFHKPVDISSAVSCVA